MSSTRSERAWLRSGLVTFFSLILAFLVAAIVMVLSDAEVMARYSYFFARPTDALQAS